MGRVSSDWLCNEPGAKEFGAAYLDHFDVVYDAAFPLLETRAREMSRERFERALAGDWDFYAETLRCEGSSHAMRGKEFGDWQELPTVQLRVVVPVLIERYAAEPERLNQSLQAFHKFIQYGLAEMGEAYVRQSERALETWRVLFEQMPDGICVLDSAELVVRFANAAFRTMYGLSDADLGVRSFDSLFEPEDLARVRQTHRERAYAQGRFSYEAIHVRQDGTRFPVLVDGVKISSLQADALVWGISVRDLSERQQMEVLRVENRRVQEASRLKSEFLANMSHELRTPLNSILGFSELLVQGEVGELSPQQQDFVGDIYNSGKHLLRLINDVLDLSRVEAGKMEFHPERVDLAPLVREVIDVLRAVATETSIRIEVTIAPELGSVQLDPARLKQVLYNYLSNAIKFSPTGGVVEVRAKPDSDTSLRVEVQDHGHGISESDLGRLFVDFEQLDPSRAKSHAGTGLGLALTRRLVEAQGGAVGVKSAKGAGSTFFVVLPCHRPSRVSLPQPRRIPAPNAHAPRVLVIEDDPADQERIVRVLVAAGYAVDTAASGAQALRALDERRYDAITLDLILPDTNGLALLSALRRRPGVENLPVIVISVVSEQVTGGFVVHDALQKPLQPEELLSALRRAEVVPPAQGPVLIVDDDESSTRLISATLGQMGFRVQVAHDGHEALVCCRRERPAAVILDLLMPNLDGFGFMREFRREPVFGAIPILIWTVKDLSQAEQEKLLESASAVLPKDGSGLRHVVDTLMRHVPAPRLETP